MMVSQSTTKIEPPKDQTIIEEKPKVTKTTTKKAE